MKRKSTIDRAVLIRELMDKNGYSQSEVARVLELSRQAINQILNRDKHLARKAIGYDLKHEKLSRPTHCSNCKSAGRIEAHHPDHNDKRTVIWLCKKCHMAIHVDPNYNKPGPDLTASLEGVYAKPPFGL